MSDHGNTDTRDAVVHELRNTARSLKRLANKVHGLVPRYAHDPAGQERLRSHACGIEEASGEVLERAARLNKRKP